MTRVTDPEFWDKVVERLDELGPTGYTTDTSDKPPIVIESYVGPEASFCVLGLVHRLYEVEEVKRTRRQRLWSAIRHNPIKRWFGRLMHDRYCCGYCHGPY